MQRISISRQCLNRNFILINKWLFYKFRDSISYESCYNTLTPAYAKLVITNLCLSLHENVESQLNLCIYFPCFVEQT